MCAKRKIPGIGPKLAGRLMNELKDKVLEFQSAENVSEDAGVNESVISALMNLGYKRAEIDERVSEIEDITSKEDSLEVALRESLKVMKKR